MGWTELVCEEGVHVEVEPCGVRTVGAVGVQERYPVTDLGGRGRCSFRRSWWRRRVDEKGKRHSLWWGSAPGLG